MQHEEQNSWWCPHVQSLGTLDHHLLVSQRQDWLNGVLKQQSPDAHGWRPSTMYAPQVGLLTDNLAFKSSTCFLSPSTACALLPPAVLRFMVACRVRGFMVLVLPSTPILRVPCRLSPVGLKGTPAACSFWTLYLSRAASQSPPYGSVAWWVPKAMSWVHEAMWFHGKVAV